MITFKKFAATLLIASVSTFATADNWPTQPIRLIVPYPPGGGNDNISRMVAKQLEARLKVSVVVDNKGGGGGAIGVNLLKQAKPDGYTLATVPSGPLDVNPAIMSGITYDRKKDFTYIGPMVKFPLFMAISPTAGVKTIPELIAKAKAEPGKITYSSAGIGNSTHLAGALLAYMIGTNMTHVAYRGSGPAALAVLSGEVTFTFGSGPSILGFVKAGKAIGVGVGETSRLTFEPSIPTISELGVSGYEANSWAGIVAPAGIPQNISQKLTGTLREIMNDPEFRKQVIDNGMEPLSGSGDDFRNLVEKDAEKWGKLIKAANIKAE